MSKGMRFAFFGSSLVSAYWNGAATYYRGLIRNLHQRGHRIVFYEPDAYGRQQHRDIDDPDWAHVVVYAAEEQALRSALQAARQADVIVKTSGVGVFDDLLEAEILELKRTDKTVVFWDVDAPATLDRMRRNPDDPFRRLVPQYDLILTYGGGKPVVEAYREFGAQHCIPVYNALDTSTHYPVAPDQRFAADLGFLGNRLPDREARVDQFFLQAATALPNKQFLLGGSGWEDKPMPANVRYAGHIYTRDHNAFNATPSVILNISRESMARYGYSPANRVFEATGAGACLITDAWEGIAQFLEPDEEILVAESCADVARLLAELDPARAQSIGQAALQRVRAEHTYAHRAAQVEAILTGRDHDTVVTRRRHAI